MCASFGAKSPLSPVVSVGDVLKPVLSPTVCLRLVGLSDAPTGAPMPTTERQARPLTKIKDPEERAERVWAQIFQAGFSLSGAARVLSPRAKI